MATDGTTPADSTRSKTVATEPWTTVLSGKLPSSNVSGQLPVTDTASTANINSFAPIQDDDDDEDEDDMVDVTQGSSLARAVAKLPPSSFSSLESRPGRIETRTASMASAVSNDQPTNSPTQLGNPLNLAHLLEDATTPRPSAASTTPPPSASTSLRDTINALTSAAINAAMEKLDNATIAALNADISALQNDITNITSAATTAATNAQQRFTSIDSELKLVKQSIAPDVIAATVLADAPTLQSLHDFAAKAIETVLQPTHDSLIAATKAEMKSNFTAYLSDPYKEYIHDQVKTAHNNLVTTLNESVENNKASVMVEVQTQLDLAKADILASVAKSSADTGAEHSPRDAATPSPWRNNSPDPASYSPAHHSNIWQTDDDDQSSVKLPKSMFNKDLPTRLEVRQMPPTRRRDYYMHLHLVLDAVHFLHSLDMIHSMEECDSMRNTQQLILSSWIAPGRIGPIRKYLLSKDSFPSLDDLKATSMIAFYDEIQSKATYFLIALVPFDSINLQFPVYGLFLPGIGKDKYKLMAEQLYSVLKQNLPTRNADVANQILIAQNTGSDGFQLFWNLLVLSIPGFNNNRRLDEPLWSQTPDIAKFANAYSLYFRLQRFRGMRFSDKEKSLRFLNGIQEHAYSGVVATLCMQISLFKHDMGDDIGSLPTALHIGSLAVAIKEQMRNMVVAADLSLTHTVNRAAYHSDLYDTDSDDGTAPFDLPGIDPVVRAARDTRQRQPRPDRNDRSGRGNNTRSSFQRPKRAFDPSLKCGACKMSGHADADCFHLARALWIEKYLRNPNNDQICKEIEKTWLKQHSARDDGRFINSRKVLHTYLDENSLSADQLEYLIGPDQLSLWTNPVTDPSAVA